MRRLFWNPDKAKEEKKEQQSLNRENERRIKYFQKLANDRQFKEYILDGIINKEIERYSKMPTFQGIDIAMILPSVAKSQLVKRTAMKEAVEQIKNQIIVNF